MICGMRLPDIKTDSSLSLRPDRVGRKLASILKESPGPKKPASLQSTALTRLVRFEAKTWIFISAVCLGVKAYRFSRTSNSRKLRLSVDKFIRTKNLQWRLNLREKISGKAGVDITLLHFTLKTVLILLCVKTPPLSDEKLPPPEILLFWLFTRKISPHGVSKTLSRRYLNSTESPVPVVTQASTE